MFPQDIKVTMEIILNKNFKLIYIKLNTQKVSYELKIYYTKNYNKKIIKLKIRC